jgi:urocanate hydratase
MVLDGTPEAEQRLQNMLFWDVNNGIARRSWARNEEAMYTIEREMDRFPDLKVTIPNLVDDRIVEDVMEHQK